MEPPLALHLIPLGIIFLCFNLKKFSFVYLIRNELWFYLTIPPLCSASLAIKLFCLGLTVANFQTWHLPSNKCKSFL